MRVQNIFDIATFDSGLTVQIVAPKQGPAMTAKDFVTVKKINARIAFIPYPHYQRAVSPAMSLTT
jgi:hypothetical protein